MNKSIEVLLVEDSEADRFLFEVMLEEISDNVLVFQACDGQQAVDMLVGEKVSPDIIFLDINMPRMNGYEFLESSKLLLSKKNIEVYMLTSSDREEDKMQTATYNCVKGYLEKPCTSEALVSSLYHCSSQL
jgi:CheY-like chemotaxis protein